VNGPTSSGNARHRFAVDPDAVRGGEVRFPATVAHQMRRVLRLRPGQRVIAFDGRGGEYTVALVSVRDDSALGAIEAQITADSEPRLDLTLCQALLPRDKFELVLQKATEVGVRGFVPLLTERSLVPASALDGRRQERWRRIIQEAAEQSGRVSLPILSAPLTLPEALARRGQGPGLLAWERERSISVREALAGLEPRLRGGRLTLFVGPEGGFSEAEVAAARNAGLIVVSLGPRILRAETAGPILTALALYQAGDLEPAR
jgi:16S rRNA (uracil1498-N3)-methyltransferase